MMQTSLLHFFIFLEEPQAPFLGWQWLWMMWWLVWIKKKGFRKNLPSYSSFSYGTKPRTSMTRPSNMTNNKGTQDPWPNYYSRVQLGSQLTEPATAAWDWGISGVSHAWKSVLTLWELCSNQVKKDSKDLIIESILVSHYDNTNPKKSYCMRDILVYWNLYLDWSLWIDWYWSLLMHRTIDVEIRLQSNQLDNVSSQVMKDFFTWAKSGYPKEESILPLS